jgi:hypothetical protein
MKICRINTKQWLQARDTRICDAFDHTLDNGELGRRRNLESGLLAQDVARIKRMSK